MQEVSEGDDLVSFTFTGCEVKKWESVIKALFEASCGTDCDPRLSDAALITGARYLHKELNHHRGYLDALEAAYRFSPTAQQPWGWRPVIVTPFLQVGLLSLFRGSSIPLHDHPNAWGVQQVVAGKVRTRQYQFAGDADQHKTLVSLEEVNDTILVKGKHSTFTPWLRNLHELESISRRCVSLSMMINPYRQQDGSWYYPVSRTVNGIRGLYSRIKKRSAIGLAQNAVMH